MKAIRLKEKDKEPVVFNSFVELSKYWKISPSLAQKNYYAIKHAKDLIEKFNVENIEESEFVIPDNYYEDGYREIEIEGRNIYVANKDGIIVNAISQKEIKPYVDKKTGYCYVILNYKRRTVHRIIANLFVQNPNNYPIINHKNEIKSDNRAENLEWCTHRYNQNYGKIKAKIKIKRGLQGRFKAIPVKCSNGVNEKIFRSITQASKDLKINRNGIMNCIEGKQESVKGYVFSKV